MNAYELADIVDRWAYKESAEYLTDAANMLRQQADRIVALEKELYFKNYYEELPDTPVGIYTTPQIKELSDEEMKQITKKYLLRHLLYVVTEEVVDDHKLHDVVVSDFVFARAILKKASEK